MKAHIIFNNDNPIKIILDDLDKANSIIDDLKLQEVMTPASKNKNLPNYFHIHSLEIESNNYIQNTCDVCLGHPLPNQNCICDGTGTLIGLLTGLRKLIYNLQNQLP
jgi:hypothetical protein